MNIVILTAVVILSGIDGNPGVQSAQIPMPAGTTVEECQADAVPVITEKILQNDKVSASAVWCSQGDLEKTTHT